MTWDAEMDARLRAVERGLDQIPAKIDGHAAEQKATMREHTMQLTALTREVESGNGNVSALIKREAAHMELHEQDERERIKTAAFLAGKHEAQANMWKSMNWTLRSALVAGPIVAAALTTVAGKWL